MIQNKYRDSCSFSTYQPDWRIFKEFKNDFWKEFVLIPKEPIEVSGKCYRGSS
jgi:hypothetical protein